ncbi:hypothetical protein [Staphylococcus phage vB_Sau_MetB16]
MVIFVFFQGKKRADYLNKSKHEWKIFKVKVIKTLILQRF